MFSTLLFTLLFGLAVATSQERCCIDRGVSSKCARALCDPSRPPDDFHRYSLFDDQHNCSAYLDDISFCLAGGRDNTECCKAEASDADQNACFEMCSGAVSTSATWPEMQTCIAVNIVSMYGCFVRGYKKVATQPRRIRVESMSPTRVVIKWDAPEENAHLVRNYKIFITDSSVGSDMEMTTESLQVDVDSLVASNRYSVYVISETKEGKSAPSDVEYFTTVTSSSSASASFRPIVVSPHGSPFATLACTLRSGKKGNVHVDWERKDGSSWRRVDGSRYRSVSYPAVDEAILLSALHIRKPIERDHGVYRCFVRGHPSESREVRLISTPLSNPIPSSPPETPLECCSKRMTRPGCTSMCTPGSDRKRNAKPGAYLPHFKCQDDMHHLMQCTVADVENGPCCIRKKVPYHCLGMCDKNIPLDPFAAFACMEYMEDVVICREESLEIRPRAVSGVILTPQSGDHWLIEWRKAEGADSYLVYYKMKGASSWKHTTTSKTSVKVKGAEEIAVISVNAFGRSSPIRLGQDDSKWVSNYE